MFLQLVCGPRQNGGHPASVSRRHNDDRQERGSRQDWRRRLPMRARSTACLLALGLVTGATSVPVTAAGSCSVQPDAPSRACQRAVNRPDDRGGRARHAADRQRRGRLRRREADSRRVAVCVSDRCGGVLRREAGERQQQPAAQGLPANGCRRPLVIHDDPAQAPTRRAARPDTSTSRSRPTAWRRDSSRSSSKAIRSSPPRCGRTADFRCARLSPAGA